MLQEMADAQARGGEGVPSLRGLVSASQLREYESQYLTGEWTTVADFIRALHHVVGTLRDLVAHGQGEWSAVIPTKEARRLIVSAMRVPGRQKQLPMYKDLEDAARAETALSLAAARQATEIAVDARERGMSIEELRQRVTATSDSNLTLKALRAIGPAAPQILVDGYAFPSLNGAALPKTLPSSRVHKLRVTVAAVHNVDCVAYVSVQRVLQGDASLESLRVLLPVKCPDPDSRKHLIAAELADEMVEIHVGGEFPTLEGGRSYDLQLVALAPEKSTAEMLESAVSKMKKAEQLSLVDSVDTQQPETA